MGRHNNGLASRSEQFALARQLHVATSITRECNVLVYRTSTARCLSTLSWVSTKTAKVLGVPTVLTRVLAERGGFILKDIPDVFPDQKPTNRTTLNTWEDKRVVDAIKMDHFLWMGSLASEPDSNEACGLTSRGRRRVRTGTGNGTNWARPVQKPCSCGNRRVKRRSLAKGWKQT
jgi:hypothetical protein